MCIARVGLWMLFLAGIVTKDVTASVGPVCVLVDLWTFAFLALFWAFVTSDDESHAWPWKSHVFALCVMSWAAMVADTGFDFLILTVFVIVSVHVFFAAVFSEPEMNCV